MPLTREKLGRWAQECWNTATECLGGTAEFEDDARKALRRFVADAEGRGDYSLVVRAINAAPSVDMEKPANRKGAVPAAMGLVERRSKATTIRNLAIRFMMDRLQDHSEVDGDGNAFERHSDIYPYLSPFKAAKAVVVAFDEARLDSNLDESYIIKIAQNPFR